MHNLVPGSGYLEMAASSGEKQGRKLMVGVMGWALNDDQMWFFRLAHPAVFLQVCR
jgi:hypothetical protein